MTTRRLRVLHLDHSIEPGGAELALRRLLDAADWDPRIILPRGSELGVFAGMSVSHSGPAQPPGAASSGPLGSLIGSLRIAGAALALTLSRDLREADVIHANSTRSALYGAIASRIRRKPLVVHVRDTVDSETMGRAGFALYTRLGLPSAHRIIANSHATLASAKPFTPAPAEVIPSPSGIATVSHADVPPDSVRTIGMIARIAPWKGQDLLIRAFAREFAGTRMRLRIVGGTSFGADAYLSDLRALAKTLGIADQVDFVGHADDVAAELRLIDVCVQCSLRPEPLGQNVLQYLAAGKPTVAADEGGPQEWVDDGVNGVLVPPRDVAALAAALQRLSDDGQLRQRIARGASRTPGLADDRSIARRHEIVFRAAYHDARDREAQDHRARRTRK